MIGLPSNNTSVVYVGQMVKHTSLSGTHSWPIVCIKVSYKLFIDTPPCKTSVVGKIPTVHYWAILKANVSLSLAGLVQCLQYYYQSGCLYRLKALGERHNLDLTVGKDFWVHNRKKIWQCKAVYQIDVCLHRGLSVVDVAGTDISSSLSLPGTCKCLSIL